MQPGAQADDAAVRARTRHRHHMDEHDLVSIGTAAERALENGDL